MVGLIKLLEQFNRKERFFLIGQALGNEKFQLSKDFRKRLGCELGLDRCGIEVPCDAFVAMDYHLDAVAGSLWAYRNPGLEWDDNFPKRDGMVTGTQRDIDLLIAFKEEDVDVYHLVFLEAKGYESNNSDGYATWNTKEINEQIQNKACQLESIFGHDGGKSPKVRLHFCLMSHHCPTDGLKTDTWPTWMKKSESAQPHWLKLNLPPNRLRAARCNPGGDHSKDGDHFRIV